MDSSHIGKFGTLSVMKSSDPTLPVAHFPIDEEETTIGRDPNCSVRLYYETVSRLHCKIIFQERKAFLVVLGASGVICDGCTIFPTSAGGPTTVPISNDTEIELHRKRFRFIYPPKGLRAAILNTPEPDTRTKRTLRMSMINSAQVFSPGPSDDPRENLRTLQSPLKPRYNPSPSPLKPSAVVEEEEGDIVLVDGNHPSVVQDDDDDLVILEKVQPPVPPKIPGRVVQFPQPSPQYQTPNRRPRSSLHRAVLIRSAQKAARQKELETEDVQEEMEVEKVVAPISEAVVEEPEAVQEWNGQQNAVSREEETYRPLGNFMTPQVIRGSPSHNERLGGSVDGPRRVRVLQAWKVQDIVIPENDTPKKEDFAPVFHRERISDEERKAIRDRRKSALNAPDPIDAQIPGIRRLSSVILPAPPVFSSPAKDSQTGVKDEEETTVLFEKMKAVVEGMKQRKSRGASLSPMKTAAAVANAEAEFWGSAREQDMDMDRVVEDNQLDKNDQDYPEEAPEQEMDLDKAEEAEVERQTSPGDESLTSNGSLDMQTSRIGGIKHMFTEPRELKTPAFSGMKRLFTRPTETMKTPTYTGVRDIFKTMGNREQTPRMDGVRNMFALKDEAPEPVLEGLGEMLATPAGYRVREDPDIPLDIDQEEEGSEQKRNAVVKKRKGPMSGGKRSEMGSPEPEPSGPRRILRNPKADNTKPAGVSAPRSTRTRKVNMEDEATTSKPAPQSEPPRKAKSINDTTRKEQSTATAAQKSSTTSRRTRTARVVHTESGSDSETVKTKASTVRRGTKAIIVEETAEADDLGKKVKRAVRGKRTEAIKEEDDSPALKLEDLKRPIARLKTSSKTPIDNPGKENTPEALMDEDEDTAEAVPAVPAKTKRGVGNTTSSKTAVKDEPGETKAGMRTRTTRSRK